MELTKVTTSEGFSFSMQGLEYACALHSFSDTSSLVSFALDSMLDLVDASAGSIFLWDERAKELVSKVFRGAKSGARLSDVRVKLKEGVSGLAADKGHPLLVTDIHTDERFARVKRCGNYSTPSFICLPLLAGNKLIGVVNITEKSDQSPFTESELTHAEMFSRHVAVAYESLRLKQRWQNENQMLARRITELGDALKRQEHLVSIGKLSSNLAHELSNPLDAIRRFVNLALDECLEDSLAREYLLKAKKGVRRAVHVIRGLLQFSRGSFSSQYRTSDLHQVIEITLDTMAHDNRVEKITVERLFTDNRIMVKDCGLQLVFKNLFENAVHAIHSKGSENGGKLRVETRRDNGHAIVSVQDTGTGIPNDIQNRVFEPFFTTKHDGQGTGIGLAICKDIVERCGGQICVESDSHIKGAEFTIKLPCLTEGQDSL